MKELDTVRVQHLHEANRSYFGSDEVKRAPEIGDVGAIVDVLGAGVRFTVECVDAAGSIVWVADFDAAEIALISRESGEATKWPGE
ncbi:MAG: hypothetical protein AAFQ82_14355 [Myxococcota bacterium]